MFVGHINKQQIMKLRTELMLMMENELRDIDIMIMSLHPHFDSSESCSLVSRKKAFKEIGDFVRNFEQGNND
jgi:hypothetical protein